MSVLDLRILFDEKEFLQSVVPQIQKALDITDIQILPAADDDTVEKTKPGKPYITFA
jgi:hypothetical protein